MFLYDSACVCTQTQRLEDNLGWVSSLGMPSASFETESLLAGRASVRLDSPRHLPASASPTLGL